MYLSIYRIKHITDVGLNRALAGDIGRIRVLFRIVLDKLG